MNKIKIMPETNRIEYKRELTSELDIEKEVVALIVNTVFTNLKVACKSLQIGPKSLVND